ncbi:von Willebrand factor [Acipenser ruthenus]|uniref:von Willebrand factor n=1 Tax=Acipenser ruthenus TaxID=7906 RepID=A0A444UI96_ACIRT|nr:von Willebrand factor [Acipenser ruthenus]
MGVQLITDWPSSALVSGKGGDALTGRCSLFGKDHIQTFDGNFYDFPGDCSYKLAGDCQKRSFSLLGDFQKGQRKSVSVYLGEFFEIHLFLDGTVTQGEKRLSLPYASSGIFIETEAGYYKVSSEEYGFQIMIDSNGNIHTLLSTKHSNRTCGLCGNFNDVPEDDYMAQEEFLTENSYDFANSWALHGAGAPCKRVLPASQTCNVSTETQEDPMSRCRILSSSPVFLKCAHVVDPEPFVTMCEDDTCHCHEGPECQCHAFLEYARTCAQRGVILRGWPAESHCSPRCPFGMQYNECTSPCSHTCQSLNISDVCKEGCGDGCSCPEGKVLDGEHCVDSSQCSCTHTGRRYPPGSSIAQDCNTCICRHGLWECSNEECPGECFVTGQSHFKSFDNKFFTFSGVCQYLFAKDCQDNEFAAIIETVQCADDQDAVCTRSATLRFHKLSNITIKMKHGGGVSVNGLDIQTPLVQGPLRIQHTVMSSVRLTYNEDFQLDWDGRGKLLLKLSPVYSGKMCGLCGNYNGNQGDDFLTPAGLVEAQAVGFGNSWKINGGCEDVTKQDSDPCNLNPKRGSDKVGEENFSITKEFLLKSIQKMSVGEKTIRITIIQYSYNFTIEYSFTKSQRKEDILERIRHMEWRGGNATNTGAAVSETTIMTAQGNRDQVPDLVFLISSNPPSDTITKPAEDSRTKIIPIGVGPQVREMDLELIGYPQKPIMIKDYKSLLEQGVTTVIETITAIASPSLPAAPTTAALHSTPVPTTMLPSSVPCDRPMDVIIMLEGSAGIPQPQFEEMKTFVKAFISKADIGANGTHLAVLQYGRSNNLEVSWVDRQNKENLISSVNLMQQREAAPTRLGDALRFTVQSAVSEVHGGRPGVPKIAVLIATRPSQDPVEEAAREALTAGVAVFPIGAGTQFDEDQLVTMAGHAMKDNIIHLHRVEDLPTMVTLGNQFIDKLCRVGPPGVCVDDEGNERRPGETWILSDQCHSLLCHPNGAVTIQNHKVNCEKMQKPACRNNLPSVKIQETCGCRWACPCMCMGSSTSHIVTFDGLAFKLTGSCSYTLLHDAAHGNDIILHNAPCPVDPKQSCMKSVEVKHAGTSIALRDDMKVTVDGVETPAPFSLGGVEVTLYGALMHEVKIPSLGYVLTFTPGNNEFTVQLTPTLRTAKTSGLCGFCDQNEINDFGLKDGSVTLESRVFIKEWTIENPSGPSCEPVASLTCTQPASDQCLVLHSSMFQLCHAVVPPAPYIALCQEASCHGQDLCQIVAAYSHLCRLQGVCINWRSAGFCAQQCPGSMVFDSCRTGCIQQCTGPFNSTLCMDTPTEGCFCPPGKVLNNGECVEEEACSQCLDENRVAHKHLDSWIPAHDPCQICMCLDNRNINCTARPCSNTRAPVCGACEVLTLKKGSEQCCQEYECVCDVVSCALPPVPTCADGMRAVLTNPGECKPAYECACKKEVCKREPKPSCPSHRKLSARKTQCCDRYDCTCNCVNSTVTCPPGYLSTSVTNDCGCTAVSCLPDNVCVHHEVVYHVGSVWEEACKTCSCTGKQDKVTALHIVECTEKVCNEICPVGTSYIAKDGECCGKCKKSACQEHFVGGPLGDMDSGGRLRHVGERWRSAHNPCVINECVQVNEEVFINQQNLSCSQLDTPHCPPGTTLQCDTFGDCCPSCHCAPTDGCVMNNTVIGSGEVFLADECTRCQCSVEMGVIKRYRLLCRKVTCSPCQEGYRLEKVNGSCCGKCIATSCSFSLQDGTAIRLQEGETWEDGCMSSVCNVNERGELMLESKVTRCPPFDKDKCEADGGKVVQLGKTCCETCAEQECKQTIGILKYIKIDDCMSENQVDLHYCEGKCSSKSIYSLEHNHVESHCVCCSATATEPLLVPLRCANGTVLQHKVLNVKQCDCLSHACAGE